MGGMEVYPYPANSKFLSSKCRLHYTSAVYIQMHFRLLSIMEIKQYDHQCDLGPYSIKNQAYEREDDCFDALRPKSTAMVMAGRSVHLTTLFFLSKLEQAVNQYFVAILSSVTVNNPS